MCDCMTFPDTVEKFMEQYKIVDTDGIYMSKGAELVPIFRMRQWFEHLPSAQPEIEERMSETEQNVPNDDFISRKRAIDALMEDFKRIPTNAIRAKTVIEQLPPAQPERKRMSNKEWIDFLSEQFDVSRTSAREMLHGLMKWKAEDNFKKQFRR